MRGLDRVGGGEVVVLAGVDDDAGAGVHLAAEALVDEGADRVDVAEEDPVHRVVQHHVEPLEAGQGGDLRHAQSAGVVGQPHVAAELLRRLVEGRPHQPEVLLGGVGAGEALAGRALGHEVEEALPGRADDRDDVGALAGRGLGLRDVLVDVAGGDDQVDPGLRRGVADRARPAARAPCGGRRCAGCRRRRPCAAALRARLSSWPSGSRNVTEPGGGLLGELAQVGALGTAQGVPDGQRDAVLEPDVGADARRPAGSPRACPRRPRPRGRPGAGWPAPPRRWCGSGRSSRSVAPPCGPASGPCGRSPGRGRACLAGVEPVESRAITASVRRAGVRRRTRAGAPSRTPRGRACSRCRPAWSRRPRRPRRRARPPRRTSPSRRR